MTESTKPSATFTATPEVKAQNGFHPVTASSRNRVVRPMLRKQKMNAQVRKLLIGTTRSGAIEALNCE